MTILETIGGTRRVGLRRRIPEGSARILLKLEFENPTGSMKDRMALAMVDAGEPEESAARPGRSSGSPRTEGTGAGFIVPLWTATVADESQTVSTGAAMAAARPAGTPSG